jgi:hypothetical protein
MQELDDALAHVPNINVNARLTKLATGIGLGKKFAYTISSKEVVINMNVEISMDAAEVEKVIITRANSAIRQRLDLLADKADLKPQIMPNATYNPTQSGVAPLGGNTK